MTFFRQTRLLAVVSLLLLSVACGSASTTPPNAASAVEGGREASSARTGGGGKAAAGALTPAKSPNDDNAYRLVTLKNGLKALLISDPDAPKAAASLDVHVGSGDNPPGRGGLAHFLEHMLFLGTEKYPDAAEYERYITEHGGSRNAYTSFEHTNYFFDIDPEFLNEALDRFAQFFVAPNFDADYVERERNAVHAEYQMGLKSDGRRGLDVLQAAMNPEHPFSQFSVGSLESLADRDDATVREDLLAFYERYYSANIMRLSVMGNEPLDELEALVRDLFAAVPNRNTALSTIDEPLFIDAQLPMLITVEPTGTAQQLEVNFQIEDYRSVYEAKPMSYVASLVGHEGEGSLLSQLKRENLAEGLSAGAGLSWRGGAMMSVSVSLTDKGVEQYERVLQLVFAYLDMLREQPPQQRIFDEQAALATLAFRFKEPRSPISTVAQLSSVMHYYDDADILTGPYLMERFDAQLISEALEVLRPERAQVMLTAPGVQTDRRSPYYEVPYAQRGPEAVMLSRWDSVEADEALHLPPPNPFIAENLELLALAEDNPANPVVRLDEPRKRIWYRQASEFRVPKGMIYVSFRSPLVGATAKQKAAATLYTRMVTEALNEYTYPAVLAGLGFDFYRHAQGISLRVRGYNDKQMALLEELLESIASQSFDAVRFERVRSDMIRELSNTVARRPSSQLLDNLRRAISSGEFSEAELIAALEDLSPKALEAYRDNFWESARAEAMIYGNHAGGEVQSLGNLLDTVLRGSEGELALAPEVLALDAGDALLLEAQIDHDDAVVAWYLQGEGQGQRDRALIALTAQIFQSGFFQQLRTEQQLGYVVSSFAWRQYDVPGLMLLVQSPSHDAAAVHKSMEVFLRGTIDDIDEAQFERHRAALIKDVLKPHENLGQRAGFYWQAIAFREWGFDQPQLMAEALEGIDYQQWREFYQRTILDERRSLLGVSAGARGVTPKLENARRFEDPAALRAAEARYEIDLQPL